MGGSADAGIARTIWNTQASFMADRKPTPPRGVAGSRARRSDVPGRRILITGIASYLGTELARILEADPDVDLVVGLDTHEPRARLDRTERIDADIRDPEIARLIPPTGVDTIVHNQI